MPGVSFLPKKHCIDRKAKKKYKVMFRRGHGSVLTKQSGASHESKTFNQEDVPQMQGDPSPRHFAGSLRKPQAQAAPRLGGQEN
jgi:hypothetical protein